MTDVKWIKIVTDIFDDEKILLIESMPEADSVIVIWFKLLCLAGKQNNSGVFMLNDKIAYTDEMLATIFRRPLNTVRLALTTFESFGMVEVVDNVVTIPNWEKHQALDKMEEAKKKNRERVTAYRERQKSLLPSNDYSNVTVTPSNALDKDIDKDKEENKNKNNKKKESKNSFDDILQKYTNNQEILDLLGEWLKVRKAKRSAMTEKAIQMNIDKLDKLASESKLSVVEYLKEIICRGWAAFYPINNYSQNDKRGANGVKLGEKTSDLDDIL